MTGEKSLEHCWMYHWFQEATEDPNVHVYDPNLFTAWEVQSQFVLVKIWEGKVKNI